MQNAHDFDAYEFSHADLLKIELEARKLRAEMMKNGIMDMVAWVKSIDFSGPYSKHELN